jgi:hypothetical protein
MTRRRIAILVVLALTGTLVLEADVFVRRLAIQRTDEVLAGCVQLDEPTIDLGRYPVALRALRGHLDDVRFTADAAEVAGVRLTDLRSQVRRVRFRVLGGTDDITIHDADVSARLDERDIEQLLTDLGLPGTVRIDNDAIQIQLDAVQTAVDLDVSADDGGAVVAIDGALEPLLRLRFDVPGVTVRRVHAAPGAIHVEVAPNGNPRQVACAAENIVRSRLESLALAANLLPGS